ncbi:MAG: homoserine kinase [Haliscomenobacter sp.]
MPSSVRVFAPASVANVAVGYDILGFALNRPGDEVVAYFKDSPGLEIKAITGVSRQLPYDIEQNTAGYAAKTLLAHLGETGRGIAMEIHKKMPFGSGLGSSAASAVGGVMAINALLGQPLGKRELLPFAVLGEQIADGAYHADNVAPSLLGGIVLIRSNQELDVCSLRIPEGLFATVVYPEVEVLTREARSILKKEVALDLLIRQSGNLAGFILGLYHSDFDLIRRSMEDVVIEPQRACLIPGFYEVKEAALKAGALGCSISGAGPSIFALSGDAGCAEEIGRAMQSVFDKKGIKNHLFVSPINLEGAVLL